MLLSSTKKGFPKHRRVVMSDWKSSPNMGEHKKHVWNHHLEISKNTGKFQNRIFPEVLPESETKILRDGQIQATWKSFVAKLLGSLQLLLRPARCCREAPVKKKDFPPSPKTNIDNGTSTIPRCISYWISGFSNDMLVFRGVNLIVIPVTRFEDWHVQLSGLFCKYNSTNNILKLWYQHTTVYMIVEPGYCT